MSQRNASVSARSGPPPPSPRCLLWSTQLDSSAAALLDALAQKGVRCQAVAQAVDLMLELARAPVQALVVHEPASLPRVPRVLAAVQQFYPHVTCRQYVAGADGKPRLLPIAMNLAAARGVVTEAEAASAADEAGNGRKKPPPSSRLHLAQEDAGWPGDADTHGEPRPTRGEVALVEPPLISAEELAMLLGPDPRDLQRDSEDGL